MFTAMRSFITALALLLVLCTHAAQLRVHGVVTDVDERLPLEQVLVRVYRNGEVVARTLTGPGGRYSFVLENGAEHVIRFSLAGHVTKCYAVDTRGPAWEDDARVMGLEVEMTLFPKVPGLDLGFFDMPMGIARFTPMTGYLAWNDTYAMAIKPEVDRLMAEVDHRRRSAGTLAARGPIKGGEVLR
jgi:hypothetical protein